MAIAGGIVVFLLSLLAWGGQTFSWFAPNAAAKLNLAEAEDTVEPAFWADSRGEALWDFLTLWTMVVTGVLLIVDNAAWPYFGLVGGGVYVYFGGRGILTRVEMQRRGFRIGAPTNVTLGLAMLAVWGLMGVSVTIAAAVSLSS